MPVPEGYAWAHTKGASGRITVLCTERNGEITAILATVSRKSNGSWSWHIPKLEIFGVEPSQFHAMEAAEKML